jgi:YbbR domain-containing protein
MAVFKEIKWQLEAFFSTFPWKNLLLFSVFLLIAFSFWLMAFFRKDNVEGQYIIPIKFINVADNEVFNIPPPETIEIRLQDVGSNIFFNSFSRRDTLVIDVASYRERGITTLQGVEMQAHVRQIFSSGHSLILNPASISLELSKLQSKVLMVVFDGEITTNRANLLVNDNGMIFVPESVTAFGSQQTLDKLDTAVTELTVFRNLRTTSQLPIRIKEIEGVRFVPDQVEIHIPIEEFTERAVEVPVTVINVPENLGVKFFPSRVTVSFSVTLEEYRRISPEDLEIVLDYNDFYRNGNGRVALTLTTQPASIVNPRLSPSSVEFLFENK